MMWIVSSVLAAPAIVLVAAYVIGRICQRRQLRFLKRLHRERWER